MSSGSGPIGRSRICLDRPPPRGDAGGAVENSSDKAQFGAEYDKGEQGAIVAGIFGIAVQ